METNVDVDAIAQLLYEAFFLVVPYERQDLGCAVDKFRTDQAGVQKDDRFICFYDRTYGSLRLSGRLLHAGILHEVLQQAHLLVDLTDNDISLFTRLALEHLMEDSQTGVDLPISSESLVAVDAEDSKIRAIREGSRGIALRLANEVFEIERVYYNPKAESLMYRGHYVERMDSHDLQVSWPIEAIGDIPGVTEWGWFDAEMGDWIED